MKLFSTLFLVSVCLGNAIAQEVRFDVNAPEVVYPGQEFRLIYTLNAKCNDIDTPQKWDGFDVLNGPAVSSNRTSFLTQNGRVFQESTSFTFVLRATKPGKYATPKLTARVNGKKITSSSLKIVVEKEVQDNVDAFVETSVNETSVYEFQSVALTYKLYTKHKVNGVRLPDYSKAKDFSCDIWETGDGQFKPVEYKGQTYYAATVGGMLVTPLRKGNLKLPEAHLTVSLQVQTDIPSFFGFQTKQVTKIIPVREVKIRAKGVPAPKPADFANLTGSFDLSASISSIRTKVNEPILIRIVVAGDGNVARIPTPDIELPEEFDVNKPKISQSIELTDRGLVGTKSIEYLVVPKIPGEYTIPASTIRFFDLKNKTYESISTPEYNVKVDKDFSRNSVEVFV